MYSLFLLAVCIFSSLCSEAISPLAQKQESWTLAVQNMVKDLPLMDGNPQPAVENQFQNGLTGLQLYTLQAGEGTQAAFRDLQVAFENYQADRSVGTKSIASALTQFQTHPLDLTEAQFKTATAALIARLYNAVAAPNTSQNKASDYMNLILAIPLCSSQVSPAFVQMLSSSETPFFIAFNNFLTANPPTEPEVSALESQLDCLKAALY